MMNFNKVSRLLVVTLTVVILASGCTGPFTIEDFSASNACDGQGTIEFRMEGGQLRATTRDDVQTFMRQSGMPSVWCHGLRHVWIGEATLEGYTFDSSPDDPLQFVVDRDKGYYYEQGTGSVTTPDGEVVTLP
jgi:hypothetical protein